MVAKPETLRAEIEVINEIINDLMEYELNSEDPLFRHFCKKWTAKMLAVYDRLFARLPKPTYATHKNVQLYGDEAAHIPHDPKEYLKYLGEWPTDE